MKRKFLFTALVSISAFLMSQSISATQYNEDLVQVNVMDGLCTLVDNAATNHQASNYALCYAEAYGMGRTTEDDAVVWEDVTFFEDVHRIAVKCGYNLSDRPDTSTEFWVYLDKIQGEPVAKVSVTNKPGEENYTPTSQIVDQIYRYVDVDITAGTYDVIVVGKTENSGSCSQINFLYEPLPHDEFVYTADALRLLDVEESKDIAAKRADAMRKEKSAGYIELNVKEGECILIDNAATNHQASDYALCFAEAYGTGRTTEDDAVIWEDVYFSSRVSMLGVRCGYNLGADKAGTGTQFWVYIDKVEGEPVAKISVTDSETRSSQIVDQIYKFAHVNIPAGRHDVIIVGKTEYSGSVSRIVLATENCGINSESDFREAIEDNERKLSEEAEREKAKQKEEEKRKKAEEKAKEEAKRAEEARRAEEAKKAEEERKAREEREKQAEEAAKEEEKDDNTEWATEAEAAEPARGDYNYDYDFDFDYDDYDYDDLDYYYGGGNSFSGFGSFGEVNINFNIMTVFGILLLILLFIF